MEWIAQSLIFFTCHHANRAEGQLPGSTPCAIKTDILETSIYLAKVMPQT
jgi:hypothetical protein